MDFVVEWQRFQVLLWLMKSSGDLRSITAWEMLWDDSYEEGDADGYRAAKRKYHSIKAASDRYLHI